MKLSKGWSAYIFPKNNLRYLFAVNGLTKILTDGIIRVEVPEFSRFIERLEEHWEWCKGGGINGQ